MSAPEIKQLVSKAFPECEVQVQEDQGQYIVVVIGEVFAGLNSFERQKKIYAPLTELIRSGEVHAVTVQGWTPEEWQEQAGKE